MDAPASRSNDDTIVITAMSVTRWRVSRGIAVDSATHSLLGFVELIGPLFTSELFEITIIGSPMERRYTDSLSDAVTALLAHSPVAVAASVAVATLPAVESVVEAYAA